MEGPTESAAPPGDAGGAIASPRRRVSLRAACGMAMKDAVATLFFIVVITVVPLSVTAAGTLAAVAAAKTVSRLRGGGGAGLSTWEIEAIPAWVYAAAGEGWRDEECAVCLAEYEEGEELRRLDCGHSYHGDCIGQWLRHRAACPKCVSKVTVEVRRRGIRRLCGDFPAVLRRWVGR